MKDGTAIHLPCWLTPLGKHVNGGNVTRRLTSARIIEHDTVKFIEARLPNNRDTRRINALIRGVIRNAQAQYIGVIERTSCDYQERTLRIRLVS